MLDKKRKSSYNKAVEHTKDKTMKTKELGCGCGIIIEDPRGWLLCHATNCGNYWDFPKGNAELNEDHLSCALRELFEETDLVLTVDEIQSITDLGRHAYQDHRELHLFHVVLDYKIDTKALKCTSMVLDKPQSPFPEMDAFAVFPVSKVLGRLSKRMGNWVLNNTSLLNNV